MTVFWYTTEESEHLARLCVAAASPVMLPAPEMIRSWGTPGTEEWLLDVCAEAADSVECGFCRGEHL